MVQNAATMIRAEIANLQNRLRGLEQCLALLGSSTPAPTTKRRGRPRKNGQPGTQQSPRPVKKEPGTGDGGQRHGQPRGEPLKNYIEKVLKEAGRPMAVRDIAKAVVESGYNTSNRSLAKTVSITLKNISGVKKESRGVWTYVG